MGNGENSFIRTPKEDNSMIGFRENHNDIPKKYVDNQEDFSLDRRIV